jgi:hypothetical protein
VNSAPHATHAKQGWLPPTNLPTIYAHAPEECKAMAPVSANEKARLPAVSCNSWWAVLKNSADGRNSGFCQFLKFKIKSTKFEKIWLKCSGDEEETVKFWNTEIRSVLMIYQPT